MNTSHAKAIKGMSIANIVLGALGILGTLIIWMGLGAGGAAVANSGYDYFYTDDGYIIQTSDINALPLMPIEQDTAKPYSPKNLPVIQTAKFIRHCRAVGLSRKLVSALLSHAIGWLSQA